MKTLEEQIQSIEDQIESAREEYNYLYKKYVGGYDILSLENRMDELEKKRNSLLDEMYGY